MKKTRENLILHFKNNVRNYIIVSVFLIAGIILGAVWGINAHKKSGNTNLLSEFISIYNLTGIKSEKILIKSVLSNLRLIIVLWITGFSIYLAPINLCCSLIKGFGVGYTVSYFICESGIYGFTFSFISLFFQNIIFIPTLLIYSVYQLNCAIILRKTHTYPSGYRQIKKIRLKNIIISIIAIMACVLSGIVETGVVPTLIKLIYGNIA